MKVFAKQIKSDFYTMIWDSMKVVLAIPVMYILIMMADGEVWKPALLFNNGRLTRCPCRPYLNGRDAADLHHSNRPVDGQHPSCLLYQ